MWESQKVVVSEQFTGIECIRGGAHRLQRSPGVPMGGSSCYGIKVIEYIKLS